jgi:hypothetical protein
MPGPAASQRTPVVTSGGPLRSSGWGAPCESDAARRQRGTLTRAPPDDTAYLSPPRWSWRAQSLARDRGRLPAVAPPRARRPALPSAGLARSSGTKQGPRPERRRSRRGPSTSRMSGAARRWNSSTACSRSTSRPYPRKGSPTTNVSSASLPTTPAAPASSVSDGTPTPRKPTRRLRKRIRQTSRTVPSGTSRSVEPACTHRPRRQDRESASSAPALRKVPAGTALDEPRAPGASALCQPDGDLGHVLADAPVNAHARLVPVLARAVCDLEGTARLGE